jgi:hypothetical protein
MTVASRNRKDPGGPDPDPLPGELSPAAELFVCAIDPKTGRLVKRRRRRFRKALASLSRSWRPRRAAISELRAAGLIERSARPGRHPVVPGSGYHVPLARVRRGIETGTFERERDQALFALLAWTGVLAQRLSRSERRTAVKRLKALLALPPAQDSVFEPIPAIAHALGQVAYRQEMDIVHDIVSDVLSGDGVSVDLGGGFEGGAGDGGGGGGDGN